MKLINSIYRYRISHSDIRKRLGLEKDDYVIKIEKEGTDFIVSIIEK